MEVITKSAEATKSFGAKIASQLIKEGKNNLIVCLTGDLGSGKTTFVQGFAKELGIAQRIVSPTFILVRQYKLRGKALLSDLYHVDLYRLEKDLEFEIINLGITDVWEKKGSVVIIEWAEKIKEIIPASALWIYFDLLSEKQRRIEVK